MDSTENKQNRGEAVWGLSATIVWGLLISLVYIYTQLVGMGFYVGLQHSDAGPAELEALLLRYEFHGIALSAGLITSALVCIPLVLGAIKLKRGASIGGYLGFDPVGFRVFTRWFLLLFALAFAFDLLLWLIGRPIVPDFSIEIYRSAGGSWILWVAIVLVAPLLEEIFFRGFLFSGFAASILGPPGAIVITALIWAGFHLQYDYLQMGFIFLVGVLLGLARHLTGSIGLTLSLHALLNLAAMLLTAITLAT